jgi:hypothetical protein
MGLKAIVMANRIAVITILIFSLASAQAECVRVKYYPGDCLDLTTFACTDTKSSFVHQVCYDRERQFMVIGLRDTLKTADSVGRYYNASVKGQFDCRVAPAPKYSACSC